jgi:hypothetical protein
MTARAPRSGLSITIGLLAAMVTIIGMLGAAPALAGTHHHHHHHGPVDSDHDGMPNRWEQSHGLAAHHRNAQDDPDKDGLTNIGEFKNLTRPHVADTDSDGLTDGSEVHRFDTDPKCDDSDHDGIEDGNDDGDGDGVADEGEDGDGEGFVGVVMSFQPKTGLLLFESSMGFPVVGVVTAETELEFGGDCSGEASTNALAPGQDLFEVRFFAFDPHDEFPVFKSIVMDCPPPEV